MVRYTFLRKYKNDLLKELDKVDNDVKASAVFDTEEFFNDMVEDILRDDRKIGRRGAFLKAVLTFGEPSEIAKAYREAQ